MTREDIFTKRVKVSWENKNNHTNDFFVEKKGKILNVL